MALRCSYASLIRASPSPHVSTRHSAVCQPATLRSACQNASNLDSAEVKPTSDPSNLGQAGQASGGRMGLPCSVPCLQRAHSFHGGRASQNPSRKSQAQGRFSSGSVPCLRWRICGYNGWRQESPANPCSRLLTFQQKGDHPTASCALLGGVGGSRAVEGRRRRGRAVSMEASSDGLALISGVDENDFFTGTPMENEPWDEDGNHDEMDSLEDEDDWIRAYVGVKRFLTRLPSEVRRIKWPSLRELREVILITVLVVLSMIVLLSAVDRACSWVLNTVAQGSL